MNFGHEPHPSRQLSVRQLLLPAGDQPCLILLRRLKHTTSRRSLTSAYHIDADCRAAEGRVMPRRCLRHTMKRADAQARGAVMMMAAGERVYYRHARGLRGYFERDARERQHDAAPTGKPPAGRRRPRRREKSARHLRGRRRLSFSPPLSTTPARPGTRLSVRRGDAPAPPVLAHITRAAHALMPHDSCG